MTKISLVRSFEVALKGLFQVLRKERNLKIMVFVGILVIITGFILGISRLDFLIILIVIFLVLIMEIINYSFEKLIDRMCPHYDKEYGKIKDMLAGIVLLSTILSVIVGTIVFLKPALKMLLNFLGF